MGGRAAYLVAATNPVVRLAAAFYPENLLDGRGGTSPFDLTGKLTGQILLFDDDREDASSSGRVERVAAELARYGVRHSVHRYLSADASFLIEASRASDEAWTDLLDALRENVPATVPPASTRSAHPSTPPAGD